MLSILSNRTYRNLFAAQVVALLGTGLATTALGLLAYDLSGANAAKTLGIIFTIKMIAYVCVAPIAGAVAVRMDRRRLLIGLDIVRAACALALFFVTEVWQVYLLILALQSASAAFTPTFQATLPDVLPDEADYTRALSLSRLAYDLENILSPTVAALLLLVMSSGSLFLGTVAGFVGSALLVASVVLPSATAAKQSKVFGGMARGFHIYFATPRLRGLLALNLAASAAGAMVLVNTIIAVKDLLGLSDSGLAWTMFAFGAGSMTAALVLPRFLTRVSDRLAMISGAFLMLFALIGLCLLIAINGLSWVYLLGAWALVGFGYSVVLTPSGRILRRSANPEDRTALFSVQFALSHGCWLITYPLSGWVMTTFGMIPALLVLASLTLLGIIMCLVQWPANDRSQVGHTHANLPLDHPHLNGKRTHEHALVIDELHPYWRTHF
ncbi:MFS transporter [Pacificibacter marinus]|uniref:MFS transporter n=1 Tax=Pacificibacter marinus TaxID=658057 RepID=UPI001C065313|nr:MFS transporter [Pacificibacter marinus]MBU2868059.1 MFS transporter [Pacificibacter marinus]